ncbi:hypothetical protein ACFFHM_03225 [Halalkalibacter kiskunsagensis]|uniref:Uncharacterized protein n=1 Tax=Halalkalibacter kiskunsagensis TaxID=1548599 RepID=A0ABV6K9D9_9BACI
MKTRAEFISKWKREWQEQYARELAYFSDKSEPITDDERKKSIATIHYVNDNIETILDEFYKFEDFIYARPVERIAFDPSKLLKDYELIDTDLIKFIDERSYFKLYDEETNELFFSFITGKHDFYYELMSFGSYDREWFKSEQKTEEQLNEEFERMYNQDYNHS